MWKVMDGGSERSERHERKTPPEGRGRAMRARSRCSCWRGGGAAVREAAASERVRRVIPFVVILPGCSP
jgi:hypothetical protein